MLNQIGLDNMRRTWTWSAIPALILVACTQDASPLEPNVAHALDRTDASVPKEKQPKRSKKKNACEPRCGNCIVDPDEACDDGNTVGGDGCDATCQLDDDLSTPGDD